MRSLQRRCLGTVVVGILLFTMSGTSVAIKPITLEATAGTAGGGLYALLAGISELVKENYPEITIKTIPGGGILNQPRVGSGKSLLGGGLAPFVAAAWKGEEPFDQKYPDLRVIGGSLMNATQHWVAAKDTGVKSIKELIDRKYPMRIHVNPVGTTDEFSFRKILKFYGYTYDDVKKWGGQVFFAGYADSVAMVRDKHVDFTFASSAEPASYLIDINMGRPLRLLPFPKEVTDYLVKEYAYTEWKIPKSVYPDMMEQDLVLPTLPLPIICHASVPEDVIYAITKVICENKPRLVAILKSSQVFEPETAWKNWPAPLHPGAERYYREKGYMK